MNDDRLWGIDLGGTKIEGAILTKSEPPNVLYRERIPTEAFRGYDHIVGQIARMFRLMTDFAGTKPDRMGIATPGTLDPQQGVMKNCNTTSLNGKPLKADLERALDTEVFLANDANCFALAETRLGVVRQQFPDAKVVFGVIMGTGVGGGLVVNGEVINGLQGIGGEWGHNFLDASGGHCYCGKKGCVEKVLSGPALEAYYESKAGTKKGMPEIVADAGSDPVARDTLQRLTAFFGQAISVIINIVDPHVIVIGGGLGNIDAIYSEGMHSLKKNIFNNRVETPIVRPVLGDSAGVFGAAYLVDTKK
ncbi:MAG TPA: ROK family protein [Cyclobacteriaceae bacterium]|nr:ROK family protein [Cyclobacteriaceae bacterium]